MAIIYKKHKNNASIANDDIIQPAAVLTLTPVTPTPKYEALGSHDYKELFTYFSGLETLSTKELSDKYPHTFSIWEELMVVELKNGTVSLPESKNFNSFLWVVFPSPQDLGDDHVYELKKKNLKKKEYLASNLIWFNAEVSENETFKNAARRIVHINRWVYKLDLPMVEKLILLVLANNARINYPTVTHPITRAEIRVRSRLNPRSIKSGFDSLISKGLIENLPKTDSYKINYMNVDDRKYAAPTAERIINTNRGLLSGIFDDEGLAINATRTIILFAITDHINEKFQCFITLELISKKTGLERDTVSRNIRYLRETGLLEWVNKRRNNGQKTANFYTVSTDFMEINKLSLSEKPIKFAY